MIFKFKLKDYKVFYHNFLILSLIKNLVMAEQKIEIITKSGKVIRVMPHMLSDFARFEATEKRPSIRNTPKELLDIPNKIGAKTVILPKMETSKAEQLPETLPQINDLKTTDPVKKTRKQPVRSKAKK
jgi:hypothetical protein